MKKLICFLLTLLVTCMVFAADLSVDMGTGTITNNVITFPNAKVENVTSNVKSVSINVTTGYIITGGWTNADALSQHKTAMWIWSTGKNETEITTFLRSLQFAGAEEMKITITIDVSVTNIPNGANITMYQPANDTKPHYYMFVNTYPNDSGWLAAYNKAKTFYYMGMQGYLTTITEPGEDALFDSIAPGMGAWSGGARLADTISNSSLDANTSSGFGTAIDSSWKWACGPEAGELIKFTRQSTWNAGVKGATDGRYMHWCNNQPDGNGADGEWCMQIHFSTDQGWNDLPQTYPTLIYGYFVEFSEYDRGSGGGSDGSGTSTIQKAVDIIVPYPIAKNERTEEEYATLKEAVDTALAGDTISILRNCRANGSSNLTSSKNVIIKGNGNTVTGNIDLTAGELTLKDNFIITGKITMPASSNAKLKVAGKVTLPEVVMNNYSAIALCDTIDSTSSITMSYSQRYTCASVENWCTYNNSLKPEKIFKVKNNTYKLLVKENEIWVIEKNHKTSW